MLGQRKIKELAFRRRQLVIQSELNRVLLQVELRNVQTALQPVNRLVSTVRSVPSWLLLLAPFAGIFISRRLRTDGGIGSRILGLVKWIQPLTSLWNRFNRFRSESSDSPAEPAPDR
jgi:hypothetical protein